MKSIYTGKGTITVATLLAIWSISLVVDLPGLAITPVMSELDTVFPHASDLEIQLLSMLPNFCILPFIILSGRLSTSRSKLSLIYWGMAIFLAGGVGCFFATSMFALILMSCVIGVGCGMVIPLAAGVIADFFTGEQRVRQMGIKSGIANFALIVATLVVGWLGSSDWHLPFLVYLVPVIPLALAPYLSHKYVARTAGTSELRATVPHPAPKSPLEADAAPKVDGAKPTPLQRARRSRRSRNAAIAGIMAFYFAITICTICVTYYLPFVLQDYGMPDSDTSIITSVFFVFITLAGFILPYVIRTLRAWTTPVCMILQTAGLLLMALFHTMPVYIVAVMMIGLGYGVLQPIFYTKASLLAPDSNDATRSLSYVMTANYLGTAVTPLLFSGIRHLFHLQGNQYVFWLSTVMLAAVLVISIVRARSFVFYTSLREV